MKQLLLVLLLAGSVARAQDVDEPAHILIDNAILNAQIARAEGVFQVQTEFNIPTQAPAVFGTFAAQVQVNAPEPFPSDGGISRFAAFLYNCTSEHPILGPRLRAMSAGEQDLYRKALRTFANYNRIALGDRSPTRRALLMAPDGPILCKWDYARSTYDLPNSVIRESLQESSFRALFNPEYFQQFDPSEPNMVYARDAYDRIMIAMLNRMDQQRGFGVDEIFMVFFLDLFEDFFGITRSAVSAHVPPSAMPRAIFFQKTTPSLAHHNALAAASREVHDWVSLKMSAGTGWTYNPVSSFLARFNYNNPILSNLIPVYGAAITLLDDAVTLYEGRNASGAPASRVSSSLMMAFSATMLMMDCGVTPAAAARSLSATARQSYRAMMTANILDMARYTKQVLTDVSTHAADGLAFGNSALVEIFSFGKMRAYWRTLDIRSLYPRLPGEPFNLGRFLYESFMDLPERIFPRIADNMTFSYVDFRLDIQAAYRYALKQTGDLIGRDLHWTKVFMPSDPGDITPIVAGGRYEQYFGLLKERAMLEPIQDFPALGTRGWRYKQVDVIDGTPIELAEVVIYETPIKPWKHWFALGTSDQSDILGVIYHNLAGSDVTVGPAFDTYRRILLRNEEIERYLETIVVDILKPTTSRKEAIDKIAELYWWDINRFRTRRGTAGIADFTSKLLMQEKGITASMWRYEVSPDFVALSLTKDDFIKVYRSMFENSLGTALRIIPTRPAGIVGMATPMRAVTAYFRRESDTLYSGHVFDPNDEKTADPATGFETTIHTPYIILVRDVAGRELYRTVANIARPDLAGVTDKVMVGFEIPVPPGSPLIGGRIFVVHPYSGDSYEMGRIEGPNLGAAPPSCFCGNARPQGLPSLMTIRLGQVLSEPGAVGRRGSYALERTTYAPTQTKYFPSAPWNTIPAMGAVTGRSTVTWEKLWQPPPSTLTFGAKHLYTYRSDLRPNANTVSCEWFWGKGTLEYEVSHGTVKGIRKVPIQRNAPNGYPHFWPSPVTDTAGVIIQYAPDEKIVGSVPVGPDDPYAAVAIIGSASQTPSTVAEWRTKSPDLAGLDGRVGGPCQPSSPSDPRCFPVAGFPPSPVQADGAYGVNESHRFNTAWSAKSGLMGYAFRASTRHGRFYVELFASPGPSYTRTTFVNPMPRPFDTDTGNGRTANEHWHPITYLGPGVTEIGTVIGWKVQDLIFNFIRAPKSLVEAQPVTVSYSALPAFIEGESVGAKANLLDPYRGGIRPFSQYTPPGSTVPEYVSGSGTLAIWASDLIGCQTSGEIPLTKVADFRMGQYAPFEMPDGGPSTFPSTVYLDIGRP